MKIGKTFQFMSGKMLNFFHPHPRPPDLKTDCRRCLVKVKDVVIKNVKGQEGKHSGVCGARCLELKRERQRDRETNRMRQTDRQTDTQIDREADR